MPVVGLGGLRGRFCFTKEPKGKMREDAETYFSSSFFDQTRLKMLFFRRW